ncbi:MAG: FHA domain-containing protein, partial [Phycisphaerales bacterium]|nr:FHA domain-containing protein [Phycisphaerales bacterium]
MTIGRSKECGIVLNESSVSREHASISKEDGKVLVQDNESRAGIAVNMMFLEKGDSQQIFDRDLLTIGPWKILVRLGSENSDATAAQVAGADDAA